VHARDLLDNPARPMGPSSCSGAVPLAKGSSPAASARDPQPAFHLETRRGSLLRRRSGPRPESANRSRLDSAGTTTLGSHAGAERETLPRRSPEPPHGTFGLGRRRPETELALLEPAARCAATLSSRPGASSHPRQLHHPLQQDRQDSAGGVGWPLPVALPAAIQSRREPHRAIVAPASRERDPQSSVSNHQPTPNQGPPLSAKRHTVPGEPTVPGESGLCMMFQNRCPLFSLGLSNIYFSYITHQSSQARGGAAPRDWTVIHHSL